MAITQPTVVCDALPVAERKSTVLATFDALKALESFLLVSNHPQSPVLALLQTERPGLFEWSPLEEGPELWRTEITRRVGSRSLREVTEALSWDHDRLDDLEREANASRSAHSYAQAADIFGRFAQGLRRHIGFEEKLLFPEFESCSGVPPDAGPTAVLREEHRLIERLLVEIERGIGDPAAAVGGLRAELHQLLENHHLKEEQVLYPGTDRLLLAEERDELVRRVQSFAACGSRISG